MACAVAFWAAAATSAVAAPANGQLAAVTGDGLVSLNPDGSGLRTLWTAGTALSKPAWSPDGNRIALAAGGRIALYDLTTGSARMLTDGTQDADPAWNGDRVAFRRGLSLMSVRADGTDLRTDLALVLGTLTVSLAPDGQRLAYVLGPALHVIRLDGLVDQLLSSDARGAPAWSPDSARIAFSTGAGQIVAVTPPERGATPISPAGAVASAPAWSPDGSQVVYVQGESLRGFARSVRPEGETPGRSSDER